MPSQDHLVSFHLLTILTGKGDISKVVVFSQVSKRSSNIFPEVVPLEAKFFRHFVQHKGKNVKVEMKTDKCSKYIPHLSKSQSHKASHFKILKFQKTQNLKVSNSQSPKDSNHVTLPVLPLAIFFMSSFGPVASQASEYYQVILPIII